MKLATTSLKPAKDALAGRVILITGAHGGLGQAVAHAVAGCGGVPILLGRRVPKLKALCEALELAGAEPVIYPMDLSGATPDDYETLRSTIESEVGKLDGVVHCAAEFKGLASVENMATQDWLIGLHVNLTAPLLLTRALLPLLRSREDAAVLFLLDAHERTAKPFWGAYGVAKHGLVGLVELLHAELESSPVRIHGLIPGPMRTQLRGRAWFAEDPGTVPEASAYAGACAYLLGSEGAAQRSQAIIELEAAMPKPFGLAVLAQ
ncbi:MAG: SDR family NAD(P)-dependent oxidoreductase [Lysobacteraceae bacterium]